MSAWDSGWNCWCHSSKRNNKKILNIGTTLDKYILILDLLNLEFRKVKIKKRKNCLCS